MDKLMLVEFKKLKGSNIVLICLGVCFILPIMGVVTNIKISAQTTWIAYSSQSIGIATLLLWPCIFGVIGSYIFAREKVENTYKNLLVIPVGRIELVIAKLIALLVIIISMVVLSYIFNLSGLFLGIDVSWNEFVKGLIDYIKSGMLMFCAILPIVLIAIVGRKGMIISICTIIIYSIVSFIGIWSQILSSLLPIVVIMRICNITAFNIDYFFPIEVSYMSIFGSAIISLLLILIVTKYQEV